MEQLFAIAGVLFALYLIFKVNNVVTVGVKIINKSASLADESIDVYADDVRINLAKKRADQITELGEMEFIVSHDDVATLLQGKTQVKNKPRRATA